MKSRALSFLLGLTFVPAAAAAEVSTASAPFPNFESGPVQPLVLSPDGKRLYVLNTSDHRVEVYRTAIEAKKSPGAAGGSGSAGPGSRARPTIGGPSAETMLVFEGEIFTGLEPVSMAFHPDDPRVLFVANHVSDTVSVVDVELRQVIATIPVGDEPQGLSVAAGKLFVACARAPDVPPAPGQLDPGPFTNNVVVVAGAQPPYGWLANVPVVAVKPRDIVVVGGTVYVIPQNSGNHTTLLDENHTSALGLHQEVPDAFDPPYVVNPILLRPELNLARGWYIPNAGRVVLDAEYPGKVAALPDNDVIAIDVQTNLVLPLVTHGAGTTLFDVERNPATGHLWVAATDARNRTRFEPNLRGRAVENRVTIAIPGGAVVRTLELAPPYTDRPLAQPVALAFFDGPHESLAYVAALGSSAVGVIDAKTGAYRGTIDTGPLPSGLAVDAERSRLYVFCRGDLTLRAYDVADEHRPIGPIRTLSYDPEPVAVRAGRTHLYEASSIQGHGNGAISCASCHVFGHFDSLAWDLGDPGGSLAYYFPDTLDDILSYPGKVVTDAATPILNPLKGPMVTQSLRGLMDPSAKDDLPLHWRGDRRTIHQFRGAFASLLGGRGISGRAMQEFATFVRSLRYAPNPFQPKDRVYQGAVAQGADTYGMNPQFQGKDYSAPGSGVSCIDCHKGDFFEKDDFTGSRPVASAGSFSQLFQTAQLRMIYEKDFRDLAGFGALHDGAVDGVRGFMDFNVPNGGPPTFSNFTTTEKDNVATFVKHWDHGLAPLVGAQFTLGPSTLAQVDAFLDLAEAQARPPHSNVDLIVKGFRLSPSGAVLPRGGVFEIDPSSGLWTYRFDAGTVADRTLLKAVVQGGIATFTFTCVPPGTGRRLGVDRDEDGVFDFVEATTGLDPTDADTDADGYDDGFETVHGSDPRVFDRSVSDAIPPAIAGDRALEVFHDAATLSFTTSEPAAAVVELGTGPGLADVGTFPDVGFRRVHDVLTGDLPAGTTIHYRIRATDKNGNQSTRDGSFDTFPPFLHVADIALSVTGTGPYTVTARLLVHDSRGNAMPNVPVMGFFSGDLGGLLWQFETTTDAAGWATWVRGPFTPAQKGEIGFTPAYIGSALPSSPYFVGVGGTWPAFFYDQSSNQAHYRTVTLP